MFEYNHFTKISISSDNTNVALLSNTNYIWTGSINFEECLFFAKIDSFSEISRFIWCGNSAVAYVADGNVVLQGGQYDNYMYIEFLTVIFLMNLLF